MFVEVMESIEDTRSIPVLRFTLCRNRISTATILLLYPSACASAETLNSTREKNVNETGDVMAAGDGGQSVGVGEVHAATSEPDDPPPTMTEEELTELSDDLGTAVAVLSTAHALLLERDRTPHTLAVCASIDAVARRLLVHFGRLGAGVPCVLGPSCGA